MSDMDKIRAALDAAEKALEWGMVEIPRLEAALAKAEQGLKSTLSVRDSYVDKLAKLQTAYDIQAKALTMADDSLKWAYCGVVGSDSIVGLDCCSDYAEWLASLPTAPKGDST